MIIEAKVEKLELLHTGLPRATIYSQSPYCFLSVENVDGLQLGQTVLVLVQGEPPEIKVADLQAALSPPPADRPKPRGC